jgi:preprotein translocase subunit SecY
VIGSFVVLPGCKLCKLWFKDQVIKQYLRNLLSLFSGGGFTNASIMALVSCPILVHPLSCNFLGMAVPAVQKMQNEGESGRNKSTIIHGFLPL